MDQDSTLSGAARTATQLAAEAAAMLFANGQTTERVGVAVQRIGTVAGQPLSLRARWDELTIVSPSDPAGTRVPAMPLAVDIARVTSVEAIVERVAQRGLSVVEARRDIASVARLPPVSLARFALMAGAGAAGLGVIFGAADALTLALIAGSAGVGACLRRALSRASRNPFVQPLMAAFLAGVVASAAAALNLPVSHQLLAVCPCMVLVPGPHFLNGAIDLVHARIPLGAARLTFAGMASMAICIGLLLGLSISGTHLEGAAMPRVPLLYDVCSAGLAVAAYGSFFNMPWIMLPIPIAVGMAAHAFRWTLLAAGATLPAGALAACLLVSLIVSPVSHRFHVPWGAFAFASVVSLIPGVFLFQAAAEAMTLIGSHPAAPADQLLDLARNATTASIILVAMTCGLIVPKLILDQILIR